MLRWIVSITALIAVSSVFAQGSEFGGSDHSKDGGFSNKDDNGKGDDKGSKDGGDKGSKDGGDKDGGDHKKPTDCVPEPASFLALGVGGVGFFLARKKKKA